MTRTWSEQIEKRYALRLDAELRSWFDQETWRHPLAGAFCCPLSPQQLLDPPPGTIWAGFMLPDTLPLIGNQQGDWLCLRVAADGRVAEIICWSHGGGDWIPYGRRLPEALRYDAACRTAGGAPVSGSCRGPSIDGLLSAGCAEVAIRRDRALTHLNSALKVHSDPDLARHMNVRWDPELVRWIFDTDLIPFGARENLAQLFDLPADQLLRQDWAAAEREALRVIQVRQDLGWPLDLAGWAAERRGEWGPAVALYCRGVKTSLFSDETVRFRTHWFPEGYGKFAAARLGALRAHLNSDLLHDPYLELFWQNDAPSLRDRLCRYWLGHARQHEACAQYMRAYQCFYRAGWDCGLSDLDGYAEILDGLGTVAEAAGASALARVAGTHRRFLRA